MTGSSASMMCGITGWVRGVRIASRHVTGIVVLAACVMTGTARAEDEGDAPDESGDAPNEKPGGADEDAPVDPKRERARALFGEGSGFVGKSQWAEALGAFEQSAALRPHAVTRYNIGVCLRATGRYVAARQAFDQALQDHEADDRGRLPHSLLEEIEAFSKEIDGILVHLDVTLSPANAAIAVDGRPLEVVQAGRSGERLPVALAGTRPPGPGRRAPAAHFTLILNPGAHVVTLSRKGYEDAVVNDTFAPGTHSELGLKIARLPATLVVEANESDAVVTVAGRDVGYAPVRLSRPGGRYPITVEKDGFTTFETTASLDPGQEWRVSADLAHESPALWQRWWFWTTLASSMASVVVTTWYVTRPAPQHSPDGGGLDWVVIVPEPTVLAW